MFCYAWDLADAGVSTVAEELRARQINTITLACAYHAGKFLRPHGNSGRVFFPEDGTAYFKFNGDRYGAIKPQANSLLGEQDVLSACCDMDDFQVNAWLVLLHNSRLGEKHPAASVMNAFGDRYIYSLCPSAPSVREYAVALCKDVTDSYPVAGITLETPGFLPFEHGYHHEFALLQQNSWLNNMLGLCFCNHCTRGAEAASIDAAALHRRVAAMVDDYLASDVDYSDDMATAFWLNDLATDPDLSKFLRWRCQVVESLIAEIRSTVRSDAAVAVIPSVARPTSGAWYEGSDLAGLARVADFVDVCFYEPGVERIRSDLHDVMRRVGDVDRVRAILRPGYPDLGNAPAVQQAVALLDDAGIDNIGFYNYGHLRPASLDWMAAALASRGDKP
jgi:hypothetical protein